MIKVQVDLAGGEYGFRAKDAYGHQILMDTSPESGGKNFGSRPMQLLLVALGGCSGIDIVSILKKQRQPLDHLQMVIEGEREPGVEPSVWKYVKVHFYLKGKIDAEKARRACALSMDKYCSVAATLRLAGCKIEWEASISE